MSTSSPPALLLSLKSLVLQSLSAPSFPPPSSPPSKPPRSKSTKVSLQPQVPGSKHLLSYGSLAPVMLQLEGKKEVFLWDVNRTELLAETEFTMEMLGEMQLPLTKGQLVDAAQRLGLNIREQVQRYREVLPAHCPGQGLLNEHIVTLEIRGERVLWDLGCPLNSPELYAKVLCDDLKLHPSEGVHIAFEIRTQLREHLRRLVVSVNSKLKRISVIPERLPTPPSLSGLEENLLETLPIPVKRHKSDDHRRPHKHHKVSRPAQSDTAGGDNTQEGQ